MVVFEDKAPLCPHKWWYSK